MRHLKVFMDIWYRWSSYLGYAGYCQPPSWVRREPLARLCGGNTEEKPGAALREYTEAGVRNTYFKCRAIGKTLVLAIEAGHHFRELFR